MIPSFPQEGISPNKKPAAASDFMNSKSPKEPPLKAPSATSRAAARSKTVKGERTAYTHLCPATACVRSKLPGFPGRKPLFHAGITFTCNDYNTAAPPLHFNCHNLPVETSQTAGSEQVKRNHLSLQLTVYSPPYFARTS